MTPSPRFHLPASFVLDCSSEAILLETGNYERSMRGEEEEGETSSE